MSRRRVNHNTSALLHALQSDHARLRKVARDSIRRALSAKNQAQAAAELGTNERSLRQMLSIIRR